MRKFLMRFSLFVIFVAIILAAVVVIFSYRLRSPAIYKLNTSIRYIIIGDSHTQYAIDDSLLPETLNVSNSADSYLYSYLKIRKLLEQNKQLKGFVLGFSEHNMEQAMEDWNFKDENLRNKTAQYLPLLNWEELVYLGKKNPVSLVKGIVQFPKIKFNVMRKLNSKTTITDIGVGKSEKLLQEFKDWKGSAKIEKRSPDHSISQSQVYYLQKIVKLCADHKVELVLLSTPLHYSYPGNTESLANMYYTKELQAFKWWNFADMKLPDSYFADYEHLNSAGEVFFSKEIQKKISAEL